MGLPSPPSEREITEAVEHAREVVDAVINDEESWFDRLMALATRGFEHTNDHLLHDEYRHVMFVMMQELVRARPVVLAARAEIRINPSTSTALAAAIDGYENA